MNTEIQMFQFNNHTLRMLVDENGEPWFVAKDVADILGYKDTEAMTRKLDDDEKSNLRSVGLKPGKGYSDSIDGLGPKVGGRGTLLINESGLYSAILTCQKPQAKPFKRRVTHEILPSIRKYGYYKQSKSGEGAFKQVSTDKLKQLRLMSNELAQEYLLECGIDPTVVRKQQKKAPNTPSTTSATDFYQAWVNGQLPDIPIVPARSPDVFELYQIWCQKSGIYPLPLHSFIESIKQTGAYGKSIRYRDEGSRLRHRRIIMPMGYFQQPIDKTQQEWLSECLANFKSGVKKFYNVGITQKADNYVKH